MATIYRALVADNARTSQVITDVTAALERGRHCLLLTQWTTHVEQFTTQLRQRGLDPVELRGRMNVKARRDALNRLQPPTDNSPLLAVATGTFVGEGFDCPILDTLFLAAPIAFKGRLVQYVGRVLRPHPGKTTIGLDATTSESWDAWEGFLTGLGERGLRCPLLVISDGAGKPHRSLPGWLPGPATKDRHATR